MVLLMILDAYTRAWRGSARASRGEVQEDHKLSEALRRLSEKARRALPYGHRELIKSDFLAMSDMHCLG